MRANSSVFTDWTLGEFGVRGWFLIWTMRNCFVIGIGSPVCIRRSVMGFGFGSILRHSRWIKLPSRRVSPPWWAASNVVVRSSTPVATSSVRSIVSAISSALFSTRLSVSRSVISSESSTPSVAVTASVVIRCNSLFLDCPSQPDYIWIPASQVLSAMVSLLHSSKGR